VRRHEEVGVDRRQLAQHAALDGGADTPHAFVVAAVLHDGVDAPGLPGHGYELAGLVERGRHRLFGKHMTATAQPGGDDVAPHAGRDDVEQHVGPGAVEQTRKVGVDIRLKVEFGVAPFRRRAVDVDEADDRHAVLEWRGGQRLQPASGHSSAPGQNSAKRHAGSPP
jgi:hypothetical protein